MFVNYAHRGASHYLPENTMLSFYTGLYMGANGIETDVQKTKDGVLVLFHDDDTKRLLGVEGKIADFTYDELLKMPIKKNGIADKVPTFADFLEHFKDFDITFAIELKVAGIEREVADMIYSYGVEDKVIITSFMFDCVKEMKRVCPSLRAGYLLSGVTDKVISDLKEIGAEQLCPKGSEITAEKVEYWHSLGFNVRAWGISSTEIMKAVYEAGADGMTVNFPDELTALINGNPISDENKETDI